MMRDVPPFCLAGLLGFDGPASPAYESTTLVLSDIVVKVEYLFVIVWAQWVTQLQPYVGCHC